jgi:hypothetical protein
MKLLSADLSFVASSPGTRRLPSARRRRFDEKIKRKSTNLVDCIPVRRAWRMI